MAQTIKIKRSSTSGNKLTSSNSVAGELGLNTADKALYIQTGSSNGDVVTVAHESTLKIDESNNRVGIGTTSPNTSLEVVGDNIRLRDSSSGTYFQAIDTDGSHNAGYFMRSGSSNWYNLVDTAGKYQIYDGDAAAIRLIIDGSGNVGIGTSSPANNLHIASTAAAIRLEDTDNTSYGQIIYNTAAGGLIIRSDENNQAGQSSSNIIFETDGAARVRINSNGRVGIGTDSPGSPLDVVSNSVSSADSGIRLISNSGGNAIVRIGERSNDKARLHMYDGTTEKIAFYTDGTANHISAGNLGIGTSSPARMFTVQGVSGDNLPVRIIGGAGTSHGSMEFQDPNTTADYKVTIGSKADDFYIQAGGGEKVRVKSSGYVGVGTTAPAGRLHISGNSDLGDEDCMLIIDDVDGSAGSRIPAIMFRSNTGGTVTNQGRIRGTDTQGMILSGSSALGDDLVIQSGGVGIGTTSPSGKLHVSHGNQALGFDSGLWASANPSNYTVGRGAGITMQNADVYTGGIYGIREANNWQGALAFYTHTSSSGNTFGSTFTEKMRISSSGKLIIGDNASHTDDLLQIETPASGGGHGIQIRRNDANGDQNIGAISFGNNTDTDLARISAKTDGDSNAGDSGALLFSTQPTGGSLTERMRISSAGGIRFNSEYTFPTADGSANQVLKTDGSGNLSFVTIAGAGAITEIEDADGDTKIQVEESADEDKIRFDAAGVERFRIGSDIEVIAATDFNITGANRRINFTSGTGTIRTTSSSSLHLGTNSTNRLNIAADGKVGIGTASPGVLLHVDTGGSAQNALDIGSASATNYVIQRWLTSAHSGNEAYILAYGAGHNTEAGNFAIKNIEANGEIFFELASSVQPLRLTSSNALFTGNVGIGTTAPTHQLHVAGAGDIVIEDTAGGSAHLRLKSSASGTTTSHWKLKTNAANNFFIDNDQQGTSDFTITTDGNVGINENSPASRLQINGTSADGWDRNIGLSIDGTEHGKIVVDSAGIKYRTMISGDHHYFRNSANSTTLLIRDDAKVGINETSPAGSLHISNAAQASLVLQGDASNSGDSGEIDAAIYMLMDKGAGTDPFGGTTHGAHGIRLSTENHSGATAFRIDDWDNGSYVSRMYINTSGDVGIGTTSPNSYSNQKVLTINGTTHSRIDFETADTLRGSIYGDSGSLNLDAGGNYIRFYTGNTQKMTLLASGRLGIGHTSPNAQLHVNAGNNTSVSIGDATNPAIQVGGTTNYRFGVYTDGEAGYIENKNGDDGLVFRVKTAGEAMRIDGGTGRVGIGTSSPAADLHVDGTWTTDRGTVSINGPANALTGVGITSNNIYRGGLIHRDGTAGQSLELTAYSSESLLLKTTNTTRLAITSGGNVGIGITTPSRKLDISAAGNDGIRIASANALIGGGASGGDTQLIYWNGSNAYYGRSSLGGSVSQHEFRTGGTTRLTINSSGNVGIGTTSPEAKLQVAYNGGHTSGNISLTHSTLDLYNPLQANTDEKGAILTFSDHYQDANGYPRTVRAAIKGGTDTVGNTADGFLAFYTDSTSANSATERMRITKDGYLGIGTASPSTTLHVQNSSINSEVMRLTTTGDDPDRNMYFQSDHIYSNGNLYWGIGDHRNLYRASYHTFHYGTSNTEAMRIDTSGNVGIGTTTPDEFSIGGTYKYLAVGGDKPGIINLVDSGTSGSYLQFGTAAGLRRASMHAINGSHLVWTTNGSNSGTSLTERMRLTSGGYLMIGKTNPTFSDSGIELRSGNLGARFTRSNAEPILVNRTGSNGDIVKFYGQGTELGAITAEGGDSLIIQSTGSTGTGIRFHPSRAAVEPVRAGATIDDTISLGADTRRFKDLHLSNAANIGHSSIETSSTSTSATTQVAIATFAAATFRSAEFTIQVTNSTDSTYHMTKVLLIHDGTTPGITEYGTVFTGSAAEATFDADISSGNVRLLATPASTDSMTFKVVRHCITV